MPTGCATMPLGGLPMRIRRCGRRFPGKDTLAHWCKRSKRHDSYHACYCGYRWSEEVTEFEYTPMRKARAEADLAAYSEKYGNRERVEKSPLGGGKNPKVEKSPLGGNRVSREEFQGGGHRDSEAGKPRFDLLLPKGMPYDKQPLTRFARHMEMGSKRYGDRNWESFSDERALERAKSSAFRHFMQWFNGEDDEDHMSACYFNLMAVEYIKWRIANERKDES